MIRGAGSAKGPNEHIAALPAEYEGWTVLLYGRPLTETAYRATTDLTELAAWIEEAGDANLLLYGVDSLFKVVEPDYIGTIWVTMGADRDGVREVWRLRQQYNWLAKKRLALVVEPSESGEKPDADRLMRLTRAVQVLTFPPSPAPAGPVWAPATLGEVAPTTEEAAPANNGLGAPAGTEQEPTADQPQPGAPAAEEQLETAAEADPAPATAYTQTVPHSMRGADTPMTTPQAEQAILQRYALVRERRQTTARIQEVEAAINDILKEIFVNRFTGGVEAAVAFEARAKKLAETSAEYTQLTQNLARIEEELAKLAWLKDELEI
jgi:hypothetical protein